MISLCKRTVITVILLQNHGLKSIAEALINYIVHAVLILLSLSFNASEITTRINKRDKYNIKKPLRSTEPLQKCSGDISFIFLNDFSVNCKVSIWLLISSLFFSFQWKIYYTQVKYKAQQLILLSEVISFKLNTNLVICQQMKKNTKSFLIAFKRLSNRKQNTQ